MNHTQSHIHFYVVYDTNWMMNHEFSSITYPAFRLDGCRKASDGSIISEFIDGYILFPVAILIPKQVKIEIANLHRQQVDHKKTSNAKRVYSRLQKYYSNNVTYLRIDSGKIDWGDSFEQFASSLLTVEEVDLALIPEVKVMEPEIGPDSEVDKAIVSLAHSICESTPLNHCFVASDDTGIQAEVSHLFYRQGKNIGCPAFLDDWEAHVHKSTEEIIKQAGCAGHS